MLSKLDVSPASLVLAPSVDKSDTREDVSTDVGIVVTTSAERDTVDKEDVSKGDPVLE